MDKEKLRVLDITLEEFDEAITKKYLGRFRNLEYNSIGIIATHLKDNISEELKKGLEFSNSETVISCIITLSLLRESLNLDQLNLLDKSIKDIRDYIITYTYGFPSVFKCSKCLWVGKKHEMVFNSLGGNIIGFCPKCSKDKKAKLNSINDSLNSLPLLIKSVENEKDKSLVT